MPQQNGRLTCFVLAGNAGPRKQISSSLTSAVKQLGVTDFKIHLGSCPKQTAKQIPTLKSLNLFIADLALSKEDRELIQEVLQGETNTEQLRSLDALRVGKTVADCHPNAVVAYVTPSEDIALYRALAAHGAVDDVILKKHLEREANKKSELFARLLVLHRLIP